jgi:hypothetical protein
MISGGLTQARKGWPRNFKPLPASGSSPNKLARTIESTHQALRDEAGKARRSWLREEQIEAMDQTGAG